MLRKRDLIQLLEDQVDYQAATIAEQRAEIDRLTGQLVAMRDILHALTYPAEPGSKVALAQAFVADQVAAAFLDTGARP